jgi:hypothetical protein
MRQSADDWTRTVKTLYRVARDLRILQGRITTALNKVERLELIVATLARQIRKGTAAPEKAGGLAPIDPGGVRTGRAALRRAATHGIRAIDIARRVDGGADVQVDDGPAFTVPSGSAALLEVLYGQTEISPDGFPAWLAVDEVLARLGRRDDAAARHALAEQLRRLRAAFEEAHLNRFLIDRCRRCGFRILLRRGPAIVPAAPHSHAGRMM